MQTEFKNKPYVFHPDSHALSVVSNNVLITVTQEYLGVYLKTFNLVTGYNTDRQYVSMAAMDLIPPLSVVELADKKTQLSFYAKDCEKGKVVKFSYVLRYGWDIDNSMSTVEKQDIVMSPSCKVLYVHTFDNDSHPSLVFEFNDMLLRIVLESENISRQNTVLMYQPGFNDDRKICAAICKNSDFVVVDNKLSKFYRRLGQDFTAPALDQLSKKAVAMQIVYNQGQFFVAVNRQDLYVVNERASRFIKVPLPEGRVMGAGLVFNAADDLILTDMTARNPTPYRLPWRGIPSLKTISCLKVVSMSPEETLFESREVVTTDEFVRVLFMAKPDRIAYSTHLLLPQEFVGESLPAPVKTYPPSVSPIYALSIDHVDYAPNTP